MRERLSRLLELRRAPMGDMESRVDKLAEAVAENAYLATFLRDMLLQTEAQALEVERRRRTARDADDADG